MVLPINTMNTTYVDTKGYVRYTGSNRLLHRYIAEHKLHRKLEASEVVHHINGNKLDNRPENLHVFANQLEHELCHIISRHNLNRRGAYLSEFNRKTKTNDFIKFSGILYRLSRSINK